MDVCLTGIGLMSGTSVDGIDAALVRICGRENVKIEVLEFQRFDYEPLFKKELLSSFANYHADKLCELNFALARKLGEAALALKKSYKNQIDFVASHGQTIYHIPPGSKAVPSTLQLGEPSVIAELTGLTVVADFRTRDMAAGGQGAPLVCMADYLLFNHLNGAIVQNIGGIANLTYIPPNKSLSEVIAFDTGPGNMVIDETIRILTEGKKEYDKNGERARLGTPNKAILKQLMQDEYFRKMPPKTTGRETFGKKYTEKFLAIGKSHGLTENDLIATATALTVESIASSYERFILTEKKAGVVVVGGGGSYNLTLLKWLSDRLPYLKIKTHEDFGISSDAKESIAFCILGYLTLCNLPGNIPVATGADRPRVLGKIIPGDNFVSLIKSIHK
ncbi:MAG: anhydro-N-acetylmuramic acid kinase [Firmicutes bacterium]|nr:anhydro-N-acetylmuramic acid kinase [Bacillota bacterium]MDD4264162.1 anhydro-N-acetylmuramic acid kinase [Bacillota bacterium]MDD4694220.1 anhydro-N-acetylmuramic acid kinase [Bacillota bacterium]